MNKGDYFMKTTMNFLFALAIILPTFKSTVLAETEFYRGIDVSFYQKEINFKELSSSDVEILYIRAGEGGNIVDSYFKENYQGAISENLKFGFYYYVTANSVSEAESQATHFASLIQNIPYNLRPAMDYEVFSDVSVDESKQIALSFLTKLEELTGVTPVIYSDLYNVETRWSTEFSTYPLWVADYGNLAEPERFVLPQNLGWSQWSGYQYTDSAIITGITGNVDGDIFKSDLFITENTHNSSVPQNGNSTTKFRPYTVVKGDTLWKLSEIFQTSVTALVEENRIENKNLIYVGEILKVPVSETYTVQAGDNLTKIALLFQTSMEILTNLNHIQDPNLIYEGEILYINSDVG